MQYLLSRAASALLQRLAQEKTLCAFDFDGTLAPIVEHPDRAGMSDRTRTLLTGLARIYPCVVISGRARADLLDKLGGINPALVIGNHGAEPEPGVLKGRRVVARWKAALSPELRGLPGIWIEDKGLSLAIHYRGAERVSEARRKILAATSGLPDVRVFGGKRVVNVAAAEAPHKGGALAAARRRLGCDMVLYVGDDENDEEAFALEGNVVPVRIGRSRRSHARYYLRRQAEIDLLLEQLIALREAQLRAGRRPAKRKH